MSARATFGPLVVEVTAAGEPAGPTMLGGVRKLVAPFRLLVAGAEAHAGTFTYGSTRDLDEQPDPADVLRCVLLDLSSIAPHDLDGPDGRHDPLRSWASWAHDAGTFSGDAADVAESVESYRTIAACRRGILEALALAVGGFDGDADLRTAGEILGVLVAVADELDADGIEDERVRAEVVADRLAAASLPAVTS